MIVEFEGQQTEIDNELLNNTRFVAIDFNGKIKVRFQQIALGEWIAINGMDGYGNSIQNQVVGKQLLTNPTT